jgi:uncharacterized protein (TIGR00106 family)
MKVIADVRTTPWTPTTSQSEEITVALGILRETGLPVLLHAHGTNIEGDYETIVKAVERIHDALHARGLHRVTTTITLSSRDDARDSIQHRIEAVDEQEHARPLGS